MKTVQEKIHKEYELFFMDMIRTSKANIFAGSREIEIKKAIYFFVKQKNWEEKQKWILLACDNLLEEIYRYVTDHLQEENQKTERAVLKWLEEKAN